MKNDFKYPGNRRNNSFATTFELLEDRRLLTASAAQWEADIAFDQFGGGDARVLNYGYTKSGVEDPKLFGFEFCRRDTACGDLPGESPFNLGGIAGSSGFEFGGELELAMDGRIGLEFGLYANAGTGNLLYDGTVDYEIDEPASGPVSIKTNVDYASGAIFTQSPTIRSFLDMVFEVNADAAAEGCFFGCASVGPDNLFSINERVPLMSINRGGDGRIKFLDEGIVGQVTGAYDQLQSAREQINNGVDFYRAERDRRQAKTQEEIAAADQMRQDAETRRNTGVEQRNSVDQQGRDRAAANGGKFGGGSIITVDVGQADGGLLGVQFDVGAGFSAGGISIGQELGDFSVTMPDVALVDDQINYLDHSLSASTSDANFDASRRQLANLGLDVGGILGGGFGMGTKTISAGPISLTATTVSYDIDTSLLVNQQVDARPVSELMTFAFVNPLTGSPVSIDVEVDGVRQNNVSTISFESGADVELFAGSTEVQVQPSFQPTFEFENDIGLDIDLTGTLTALRLALEAFGESIIDLGPVFERSDALASFDLGSIFDTSFELSGTQVDLEPFIVGGERADLSVFVDFGDDPLAPRNPLQITAGNVATLRPTIFNDGPSSATNVVLTAELPDGFEFVASGSTAGCMGTTIVTCTFDNLGSNDSLEPTINVRTDVSLVSTSRETTFNFSVGSEVRELNTVNDQARLRIPVHQQQIIVVTAPGDFDDADGSPASCPAAQGTACTLRQAIRQANETDVRDVIVLASASNLQLDSFREILVTAPIDIIGRGRTINVEGSRAFRFDIQVPNANEEELTSRFFHLNIEGGTGVEDSNDRLDSMEFAQWVVQADENNFESFGAAGFRNGDLVVYDSNGGEAIPGLTNGQTYEVINHVHQGQFSFANANFQLALPGSSTAIFIGEPTSNHSSHMFNPHGLVTGDGEVLKFTMRSTNLLGGILNDGGFIKIENNGLSIGDTVTYENMGAGLDVRGLSGGTTYTVVALEDGTLPDGNPACDSCFIQLSATAGGDPIEIYDFRIATNPTDGFGGAILVDNPTNRLFLDTVSINGATADIAGGGIHSVGEVQLNNSTLNGNSANSGGGISITESAALLVEGSQLTNNRAEFGGAVHLTQGVAVMRNSIASQNVADFGGAIAMNVPAGGLGGVETWESQLFDNTATTGPAIYTFTGSGGSSLLFSERSAINKNNGNLAHFDSDGAGDLQFTSIGFNLTDNQSIDFSDVSDLIDVPVIELLDRPSVVEGIANAVVAPLGFNPNGVTLDSFRVHDDRFIIESGTLRLADGVSLGATDDQLRVDLTAVDTDGREWKDYITVQVLPQIEQPHGVDAFPLSSTSVGIIWDHATGAEDYQLFEIVDGQSVLLTNLSVDTISYVVDGLAPDSSHEFFIRAVNAGGSADSNTMSVTTERPLPVSVSDATIDSLGSTTAHVSWEAAEFEDSLRIEVLNDVGEIVISEILPAGATEFTMNGLSPSTSHEFRVAAINESGEVLSLSKRFVTTAIAPGRPVISILDSAANGPSLNWMSIPEASEYRVFDATDRDNLVEIAQLGSSESSFELSDAATDTFARYLVSAVNTGGITSTFVWGTVIDGVDGSLAVSLPPGQTIMDLASVTGELDGAAILDLAGGDAESVILDSVELARLADLAGQEILIRQDADDRLQAIEDWATSQPSIVGSEFRHRLTNPDGTTIQLDNGKVWTNPLNNLDAVPGNGIVPLDALLVINALNDSPDGSLPEPTDAATHAYVDTTGDGIIAPLDALLVINQLGNQSSVLAADNDSGSNSLGAASWDLTDRVFAEMPVRNSIDITRLIHDESEESESREFGPNIW